MDQETIVKFLSERGTLVQPEALDYLSRLSDPMDRLKDGLAGGHEVPFVLTVDHVRRLVEDTGQTPEEPSQLPEPDVRQADPAPTPSSETGTASAAATQTPSTETPATTNGGVASQDTASQPDPEPTSTPSGGGTAERQIANAAAEQVKVELDITGESTCEGTIEDFTKLFRDRYNKMRDLLRKRRDVRSAVRIGDLDKGGGEKAVIGLVDDVKTTKNGHRIVTLEDDTGQLVALAQKDESRLLELSDRLLLDEVIGITGELVRGRRGDDLFIIEEIVRPDVRMDRDPSGGGPGSAVIVSDVHLGADTFLRDGWDTFIDWLSDRVAASPDEDGVRYLIVPGDLVEGVGVYPGQEEILQINDIYDQYAEAATTLERLPEDLHIIVQPGNHDAVRPAEPQPALPEDIQDLFADNVQFVANPCRLSITGVETLLYHGVSLFDYFEALQNCELTKPVETMEEMLRRRHLCPPFGGETPLAPEHEDHMIIDPVPDVFVTGHVHAARTGEYRGTRLVNAATWQAQTDYQRMRGFDPDPCRAFEIDLSTLGVTTWKFDHEHETGEVDVVTEDVSRQKLGARQG
jgi:DNA polymerase II small subunit